MSVMPLGPSGSFYSDSQWSAPWRAWIGQAGQAAWSMVRPVLRVIGKAIAEHHTRRAVRQLQSLDDRMLQDIGLTRSTIDQAVRHGRELQLVPFAAEWAMWGAQDARETFSRRD